MLRGGQLASALVAASLCVNEKRRCGRSSAGPSRAASTRATAPLSCSRTRRRGVVPALF